MKTTSCLLVLTLAGAAFAEPAAAPRDPMRPPQAALPAPAAAARTSAAPEELPVARHLLVVDGHRYVYDGKRRLEVGQSLGDARIVAIEDDAVVVRRGTVNQRLPLFAGVVRQPAVERVPPATDPSRVATAARRGPSTPPMQPR